MLRFMARDFLCGPLLAGDHKELAALGMLFASKEHGEDVRTEVHAGHGVGVLPTQTFGQTEVNDLLHLLIGRDGVRRPVEGLDNLASLDTDEIMPKLRAIILPIFRDDERAEGSVDVERGVFFIFHTYRVAQAT